MRQLEAMDDGGVVVMAVPGNPYRCPPGPYERACMIAHFLKTKKPKSKLVIFDAKKTFSKQPAFEEAFAKYYDGIIDLNLTNEIDDFHVVSVDPKTMEVVTKSGTRMKAAVANIIPPQKAGDDRLRGGLRRRRLVSDQAGQLRLRPKSRTSTCWATPRSPPRCRSRRSPPTARASRSRPTSSPISPAPSATRRATATPAGRCLAADDSIKIGASYQPGDKDGKPFLRAERRVRVAAGRKRRGAQAELPGKPRLVSRDHRGCLQRRHGRGTQRLRPQ